MRTDVVITVNNKVRVPNIPVGSPGRASYVTRGDFVLVDIGSQQCVGRIIGFTRADNKFYIVLVIHMLTGNIFERWVEPEQVLDASHSISALYEDKMRWFYSKKDFLNTPIDVARRAGDVLYETGIEPHIRKDPQ